MRLSFNYADQVQGSTDWNSAKGFIRQSFEDLVTQITAGWTVNHFPDGTHNFGAIGANRKLIAQDVFANAPNTLGTNDQGFLYYITDFAHLVYWTGAVWIFAPGDVQNGFFQDFAITPQGSGWQLCDGTVTTYLVVGGANLATANFTTPNLIGTPAYRKAAAAYTGTINAASGSTGTGTTGGDNTGTGTTGGNTTSPSASASAVVSSGTGTDTFGSFPALTHTHFVTLSIPSLSIPGLSIPSLGISTVDPINLGILPYFRR